MLTSSFSFTFGGNWWKIFNLRLVIKLMQTKCCSQVTHLSGYFPALSAPFSNMLKADTASAITLRLTLCITLYCCFGFYITNFLLLLPNPTSKNFHFGGTSSLTFFLPRLLTVCFLFSPFDDDIYLY